MWVWGHVGMGSLWLWGHVVWGHVGMGSCGYGVVEVMGSLWLWGHDGYGVTDGELGGRGGWRPPAIGCGTPQGWNPTDVGQSFGVGP